MRILVTGATGFVGRWLMQELVASGHEPIGAPGSDKLDIRDRGAVREYVKSVSPDAVVHLAGVSFALDAARDPSLAFAVNEGGTRAIVEAAADLGGLSVLISGSSEVYGAPAPSDLPLKEEAPTRPDQVYGRSKLAQERAALTMGEALQVPVVVTRSFNHTGPGQRVEFVVPALATRVLDAKRGGGGTVAVGNAHVERDIGDVRDVVRAYRLLLEGLARESVAAGSVVNVATGRAVSIQEIVRLIALTVGADVQLTVDQSLVRPNDPKLVVGDSSRLRTLTGWAPEHSIEQTVAAVVASISAN